MLPKLADHIKNNAIAYVALFFAIGGGGGYALAATTGTTKTLHTCAVRKTGELLLKTRCDRVETPVSLDSGTVTVAKAATPGVGAVSAYANIGPAGGPDGSENATVTPEGAGEYKISVPSSVCPASSSLSSNPSINVTPIGGVAGTSNFPAQVAVASVTGDNGPQDIYVQVGTLQSGTFTPGGNVGADVQIDCAGG